MKGKEGFEAAWNATVRNCFEEIKAKLSDIFQGYNIVPEPMEIGYRRVFSFDEFALNAVSIDVPKFKVRIRFYWDSQFGRFEIYAHSNWSRSYMNQYEIGSESIGQSYLSEHTGMNIIKFPLKGKARIFENLETLRDKTDVLSDQLEQFKREQTFLLSVARLAETLAIKRKDYNGRPNYGTEQCTFREFRFYPSEKKEGSCKVFLKDVEQRFEIPIASIPKILADAQALFDLYTVSIGDVLAGHYEKE